MHVEISLCHLKWLFYLMRTQLPLLYQLALSPKFQPGTQITGQKAMKKFLTLKTQGIRALHRLLRLQSLLSVQPWSLRQQA